MKLHPLELAPAVTQAQIDAFDVVRQLRGPDSAAALRALRPRDDDYARVFLGEAADRARFGYAPFWADGGPPIRLAPENTELDVFACAAMWFGSGHRASHAFPGGYERIAAQLAPELVWVAWRWHPPRARLGQLFDGLVRLDDRWALFPKPWRVLGGNPGNQAGEPNRVM